MLTYLANTVKFVYYTHICITIGEYMELELRPIYDLAMNEEELRMQVMKLLLGNKSIFGLSKDMGIGEYTLGRFIDGDTATSRPVKFKMAKYVLNMGNE